MFTVREALKLEPLRSVRVLAGASGLDREVGFVTVMDAPDLGNWLRGKELVITTAYSIKDDPLALARIIRELAEHGAAGIGIKLRRYLDQVAPEDLALADELGIPVIEIPFELAWIDIINPVMAEVFHRQAALLERSQRIHNQFIRNVLEGGGLDAVARTLAELTGHPAMIADAGYSRFGLACPVEDLEATWRRVGQLLSNDPSQVIGDALAPAGDSRLLKAVVTLDELKLSLNLLVLPVTVQRDTLGYVLTWPGETEPRDGDMEIMERAATVTALELLKLRATEEVERRFRSQFVFDLVGGNFESERVLIDRAHALGWDMKRPLGLLLMDIDRFEKFVAGKAESEIQSIKDTILREVETVTSRRFPGSISSDRSDSVILLIPLAKDFDPKVARETLTEHARQVQRLIHARLKPLTVSIGIGRIYPHPMDIPKSYAEALRTISLGRELYGPGAIVHFDDLGLYRFLSRGAERAELEQFVQENLGALLAHDAEHSGRLVETLQVYLDSNRSLRRAAAALFVHENTLKYRLQRIQEISGLDLENAEVCLNVQVALKIHQIIAR